MHSRPYDIVLFGATGFTGQLVFDALLKKQSDENFQLAIAGRNSEKLESLRESRSAPEVGILQADSGDRESLEKMAKQAVILINTAGPFNWYGEAVVQACVHMGTHYLDITGEPAFVHQVFSKFHQQAEEAGICVVNCCGFDSIPADLGTWLTARALPIKEPKAVRAYIRTNAAFSGGTWTTAIHAIYKRTVHKESKLSSGPRHPETPRMDLSIHFQPLLQRWAIPMPVVDPHIVKRSARHLPEDYGQAFAYGQFYTVGSFWKVVRLIVLIAMVFLLVRFDATRNWLFRKFPAGTGPSEEKRKRSRFEVRVIGETAHHQVETVISGGDPGYTETAKMLSQAAFALRDRLVKQRLVVGVRTPVEALGQDLVDRLIHEGIHIQTKPFLPIVNT
ncbi:MAG: saccharopine dehydrogenase NADP-binding domain-containing protein [Saprospiraceae bacterium]|nr:saccharopine dehydrogenase NADP-binding domain-containing protein [Saprospiraceae bacterium]